MKEFEVTREGEQTGSQITIKGLPALMEHVLDGLYAGETVTIREVRQPYAQIGAQYATTAG